MARKGRPPMDLRTSKRLFKEQLPLMQDNLIANNETFIHCIDDKSFGGKCYTCSHAISNYGRVWSLGDQCEYDPEQTIKGGKYPVVRRSELDKRHSGCTLDNIQRHWLVANYFLPEEKEIYERLADIGYTTLDEIEVHHKKAIAKLGNNHVSNLQFIIKANHIILTAIQNNQNLSSDTFNKLTSAQKVLYEYLCNHMLRFENTDEIGLTVKKITKQEDTYEIEKEIVLASHN